jgi:hypothetical protein
MRYVVFQGTCREATTRGEDVYGSKRPYTSRLIERYANKNGLVYEWRYPPHSARFPEVVQ